MEFCHLRWALSTTRIGRRGCAWWFVVFNVIAIVATNSLPYPVQPFSHFILFLLIALFLDQIIVIQSSPGRPPSLGQKGDPPSRRAWHPIQRWWETDWLKLLDVAKSLSFWLEPMPKAQTFECRQCQEPRSKVFGCNHCQELWHNPQTVALLHFLGPLKKALRSSSGG